MIDYLFSIYDFLVGLLTYQDSSIYAIIDPVIGAAVIKGAGSFLGGMFGSNAQASANKTNLKIARETNALNYKMFQEQNQYNKDMWELNNAYNDPSAQASRLSAAGFNPYLGNEVTAGSSSSAPASVSPPSLAAPQIQPNMSMSSAMSNVGDALGNIPLQKAQIDNLDASSFASLLKAYSDVKSASKDWKTKDLQNWILEMTKGNVVERSNYDAKVAREEWLQSLAHTTAAQSQAFIADYTAFMLPEQTVLDMNYKVAQTMLLDAQRGESYEHAKLLSKQIIKEQVLTRGLRLSNNQLEKLIPLVVDEKTYNNLISLERLYYYQNYGDDKAPVQGKGSLNVLGFPALGFGAGISATGNLPVYKGHPLPQKKIYYVPHGSSGTW